MARRKTRRKASKRKTKRKTKKKTLTTRVTALERQLNTMRRSSGITSRRGRKSSNRPQYIYTPPSHQLGI